MDFNFKEEKRNELLSRREVNFTVTYEGPTPSRREVIGKVCALLNTSESLAVLDSLKTMFGKSELSGTVRIYDSEEEKLRTEERYLIERGMSGNVEEEGKSEA